MGRMFGSRLAWQDPGCVRRRQRHGPPFPPTTHRWQGAGAVRRLAGGSSSFAVRAECRLSAGLRRVRICRGARHQAASGLAPVRLRDDAGAHASPDRRRLRRAAPERVRRNGRRSTRNTRPPESPKLPPAAFAAAGREDALQAAAERRRPIGVGAMVALPRGSAACATETTPGPAPHGRCPPGGSSSHRCRPSGVKSRWRRCPA
jgi:hypothetical protein